MKASQNPKGRWDVVGNCNPGKVCPFLKVAVDDRADSYP